MNKIYISLNRKNDIVFNKSNEIIYNNPNELTISISVKDRSKSKIEKFSKEIAPLITNGPPGITGFSGGRPKVQEVISYWPTLISKSMVETKVRIY